MFGLYTQAWPQVIPWGGRGVAYILYICISVFFFYACSKLLKNRILLLGAFVFVFFIILAGVIWSFLVALLFIFSSTCLGKLVLRYSGIETDNTLSFLIGAGIYGTIVGLLAHSTFNYPWLYAMLIFLSLILARVEVRLLVDNLYSIFARDVCSSEKKIEWVNIFLLVICTTYLLFTLMPEVGTDALLLHLFVSTHLKALHFWSFDPSLYALALVPMLGDWIFAFAYMLGDETSARLINLYFTFVMAWQGYKFSIWLGVDKTTSKLTPLIFLTTPIAFLETNSLFVEGVWGAYILAGLGLFFRFIFSPYAEKHNTDLVLMLLMFGFALASKVITVNIFAIVLVMSCFYIRAFVSKAAIVHIVYGAILMALVGLGVYIYAFFVTGNPIFPFFNAIFKSTYYPPVNFDNPLFKSGLTWDFIYRSVFNADKYIEGTTGASGFQFLLALPLALYLSVVRFNPRLLIIFAFSVICVAFIFHSQSYLRYVYPFFVIVIALIITGMFSASKAGLEKKVLNSLVGLIIFLNVLFLSAASWSYRNIPISSIMSGEARTKYIYKTIPIRQAIDLVNVINVNKEPVALIAYFSFAAYLNGEALYPNWYNTAFQKALSEVRDAAGMVSLLKQYKSNIMIVDSEWTSPELLKIAEASTTLIYDLGRYSVREVNKDLYFSTEILANPEFASIDSWNLSPGAEFDSSEGSILVSVSSPAMQLVNVQENTRYRLEMVARCYKEKTQGRLQINWLDKNKKFISPSIDVFDCTDDWATYIQKSISPKDAAYAVVYASSHYAIPIKVKKVSLK